MKESGDWNNPKQYPLPPNPDEPARVQEPWPSYGAPPTGYVPDVQSQARKRSKWLAGLLAFLIPGTGHMYLGLMIKGIVLMLLIALNITAIVFVSIEGNNVLSIVLLSLLIPIIYFYNLFDALQSTDSVNERKAAHAINPQLGSVVKPPIDEGLSRGIPPGSILFLAAAGVVILVMADINWTHWLFDSAGSMIGAVVLIGAGVGLWFWEMRGSQPKK